MLRRSLTRVNKAIWPRYAVLVSAILLAGILPVEGQVESAKVVGIVRDNSGAVLPGAEVKITNVATSVTRLVQSDETGNYVITELRPVTYTLTVEHGGFKKVEQAAF